jgi:hypothetical protein
MITVSSEMLHAADHFIMREGRLIDRHRFAYHFQGGPVAPIRAALEAYRNVDGGYGNGLDPDLRGHGSQPSAVLTALEILDELGDIPHATADHITTWLTSVTRPEGGVPRVLPSALHTESAPWLRRIRDFSGALAPTAAIAGLLHKRHVAHPWRDHATAFVWQCLKRMHQVHPHEIPALCTFVDHVHDTERATAELDRLAPLLRAEIRLDPAVPGDAPTAAELVSHPGHLARRLFTPQELAEHLDGLVGAQQADGGWPPAKQSWSHAAESDRRGSRTVRALLILRAHGRLGPS